MKWALRYFKFKHITEIMPAHVMCDDATATACVSTASCFEPFFTNAVAFTCFCER